MQVLTRVEFAEWVKRFSERSDDSIHFDDDVPFFTHSEATCIDVEYPQKLELLPFFARYLSTLVYDDWDFRGATLWLTDWGVGQPLDEGVGYRLVEAMNRASGQPMAFEVAPAHSFRADELPEAVGMLLQPMIFAWDAYYAPNWSYGFEEFFLHVSHDSFITVVTRTKDFHDRVFGKLEELHLSPKAVNERRVNRFCRHDSQESRH